MPACDGTLGIIAHTGSVIALFTLLVLGLDYAFTQQSQRHPIAFFLIEAIYFVAFSLWIIHGVLCKDWIVVGIYAVGIAVILLLFVLYFANVL